MSTNNIKEQIAPIRLKLIISIKIVLQQISIIKNILLFIQKQCNIVKTIQILKRSILEISILKQKLILKQYIEFYVF